MSISIIVPVYNAEPYLNRCIDSILNQTYTDLEIILVDDGSSDNCPALCDQVARRDPRVKVIHKGNGGASSARNVGLDVARGEYIAFVDSDDYIDKDMYETLISIATEKRADIVECGYRWVKPSVTYDRENTCEIDIYTNMEAIEKLYFGDQMFGGISIVVWNKLYRAELFNGVRFEEGYIYEDVEITPKILYKAKKIVKYNYNFYNFFFSPNSVTRSPYSLKELDAIVMKRKVADFFKSMGEKKYHDYVESLYAGTLYSNYCECYARRKNSDYNNAARKIKDEARRCSGEFEKNPYVSKWKSKLFRISPSGYYVLSNIYRWLKAKRRR